MTGHLIGNAARLAGMSTDTLRYYERIGLMHRVLRDGGGRRYYADADLERLRFIVRAQAMDFSLAEIRQLLELRDHPATARDEARLLARSKFDAVAQRLRALRHLRNELQLLLNLCAGATGRCPILDLEQAPQAAAAGNRRNAPSRPRPQTKKDA